VGRNNIVTAVATSAWNRRSHIPQRWCTYLYISATTNLLL